MIHECSRTQTGIQFRPNVLENLGIDVRGTPQPGQAVVPFNCHGTLEHSHNYTDGRRQPQPDWGHYIGNQ
jgi:hypothetical protein